MLFKNFKIDAWPASVAGRQTLSWSCEAPLWGDFVDWLKASDVRLLQQTPWDYVEVSTFPCPGRGNPCMATLHGTIQVGPYGVDTVTLGRTVWIDAVKR